MRGVQKIVRGVQKIVKEVHLAQKFEKQYLIHLSFLQAHRALHATPQCNTPCTSCSPLFLLVKRLVQPLLQRLGVATPLHQLRTVVFVCRTSTATPLAMARRCKPPFWAMQGGLQNSAISAFDIIEKCAPLGCFCNDILGFQCGYARNDFEVSVPRSKLHCYYMRISCGTL